MRKTGSLESPLWFPPHPLWIKRMDVVAQDDVPHVFLQHLIMQTLKEKKMQQLSKQMRFQCALLTEKSLGSILLSVSETSRQL